MVVEHLSPPLPAQFVSGADADSLVEALVAGQFTLCTGKPAPAAMMEMLLVQDAKLNILTRNWTDFRGSRGRAWTQARPDTVVFLLARRKQRRQNIRSVLSWGNETCYNEGRGIGDKIMATVHFTAKVKDTRTLELPAEAQALGLKPGEEVHVFLNQNGNALAETLFDQEQQERFRVLTTQLFAESDATERQPGTYYDHHKAEIAQKIARKHRQMGMKV
jgi:hypothetical protein